MLLYLHVCLPHPDQEESRGIKHPEAVKAKQKRLEEAERKAEQAGGGGGGPLKVWLLSVGVLV